MGIPYFFGWLKRKYPAILVPVVEEKVKTAHGVPVDTLQKNLMEFDNVYLDMNTIIHSCCHPENKPEPKNEEDMMVAIFECIDKIFSIFKPCRLLYMAIDGVGPRAKLNQQRARRFRASKEFMKKEKLESRLRKKITTKGAELPPKKEHFDSNCISPGTPFMARLTKCLHFYIYDRLNSDPGWKDIIVIFSDAAVPGEGEHKIMDFIRRQRCTHDYDSNTRHCVYGNDADLIMLGLATHELHFTIIREKVNRRQTCPCELCGQYGHEMKNCCGASAEKQDELELKGSSGIDDPQFILLRLNILREYLEKELFMENLPFPFDLERTIDDWVFLCIFVGNDFLPNLPSLEIGEGAIDYLVELYKKAVFKAGDFLTDSGQVNLNIVQLIMSDLSEVEDEVLKRRQETCLALKEKKKEKKRIKAESFYSLSATSSSASHPTPAVIKRKHGEEDKKSFCCLTGISSGAPVAVKRKYEEACETEPLTKDNLRLMMDHYYEVKFGVSKEDSMFRHRLVVAYVEGLCWVSRYYYQGCASWEWYFPYHYAPFASDFLNIGNININFVKGKPFKPLEQLMAIFPAASRQHVPEPWGELMYKPESTIIDFYPPDFKIDLNGKKYPWQGVVLLPFVDEKRLLTALESVYSKLTVEEKERNVQGNNKIYVRQGHQGYDFFVSLYDDGSNWKLEMNMNPKLFSGISGSVILSEDVIHPKAVVPSPLLALPDLSGNAAVCLSFIDPQYPDNYIFSAVRLESAVDPPKVLKPHQMPVVNIKSFFPIIQKWK